MFSFSKMHVAQKYRPMMNCVRGQIKQNAIRKKVTFKSIISRGHMPTTVLKHIAVVKGKRNSFVGTNKYPA